jgi:MFS family permease
LCPSGAEYTTSGTGGCACQAALILVVGGLAVIFDTTIVSVALHTLSVELGTPVTTIQWVSTSYLLALGITVPLSAWGLARFGGKRLWLFALAVFLAGSVGSSLAWDVGSLIGWRVVQGIGGGLMLPLMTTLIFQAAGGKSLGRLVTYVALPALLGHSSVLTRSAQQIGGSFGTAILAVILESAIATHPATLADAFHVAFWWSACFSAVAVLLSLWLPGAQRAPEASRGSAPGQRTDPVKV